MADTNNSSYRDSLKSLDTEEHIDLWFYRPIGYVWACLARKLGVTPNAITIASIFLGIGAGIAFYFNDIWINIIVFAHRAHTRRPFGRHLVLYHISVHLLARERHVTLLFEPSVGYMGTRCDRRYIPRKAGCHGRLLPSVPSLHPQRRRRQRTRLKCSTA